MTKALFLGAGASPGVPSLSCGFGCCNPNNPKNIRTRTSTIYEVKGKRILVDASPDLRAHFHLLLKKEDREDLDENRLS